MIIEYYSIASVAQIGEATAIGEAGGALASCNWVGSGIRLPALWQ